MSAQTDLFRRKVADSLGPPPPTAPQDISVGQAVAALAATPSSALVLLDADRRPAGILTEADIARRVAFSVDASTPVAEVMTAPVVCIEAGEYLYRAIARMRRHGLRHLPAIDEADRLAGVVHMDEALAAASDETVARIDLLSGDDGDASLRAIRTAQAGIAADLLADGVPVSDVQGLITHVNNDLYRRVTRDLLREMSPPPADFAVIVMGSGGRGENFLTPDQDNGLVIADYPDADHDRIDGWFIGFADRLTRRMDAVGLPLCTGNVMATNPLWRKTQAQWLDQMEIWLRHSSAAAVLLADIFFDFRPVAGNAALARPVRDLITARLTQNRRFLGDMLRHHDHFRSAIGLFGGFRTERRDAAHRGAINLKYHGVQPVVAAARMLALRDGIAETATLARLRALAEAGTLPAADADDIAAAFAVVCDTLLRAQIADVEAGVAASNFVAPARLTRRGRRSLREAFRTIDRFGDGVRSDITGRVI